MSERPTMKTWDLPDITTEDLKAGESRNALNKPRKWHYEPPEPEPEEEKPEPLTAQQLEEIREAFKLFDTDDSGTIDSDGEQIVTSHLSSASTSSPCGVPPLQSSRLRCEQWASSPSGRRFVA